MLDGDMVVLVNVTTLVEQKLNYGQIFQQIFADSGWNFALKSARACEILNFKFLQFIPLNLG